MIADRVEKLKHVLEAISSPIVNSTPSFRWIGYDHAILSILGGFKSFETETDYIRWKYLLS